MDMDRRRCEPELQGALAGGSGDNVVGGDDVARRPQPLLQQRPLQTPGGAGAIVGGSVALAGAVAAASCLGVAYVQQGLAGGVSLLLFGLWALLPLSTPIPARSWRRQRALWAAGAAWSALLLALQAAAQALDEARLLPEPGDPSAIARWLRAVGVARLQEGTALQLLLVRGPPICRLALPQPGLCAMDGSPSF